MQEVPELPESELVTEIPQSDLITNGPPKKKSKLGDQDRQAGAAASAGAAARADSMQRKGLWQASAVEETILTEMGFPAEHIAMALKKAKHNISATVELCLALGAGQVY